MDGRPGDLAERLESDLAISAFQRFVRVIQVGEKKGVARSEFGRGLL